MISSDARSVELPLKSSSSLRFSGYSLAHYPFWQGLLEHVAFDEMGIKAKLLSLDQPCYVVKVGSRIGVTHGGYPHPDDSSETKAMELLIVAPPLPVHKLGDMGFLACHGVDYAYAAGAMANGIASEELVIALGKAKILSTFGSGGLSPARIESAIHRIQEALPQGPYAFNLLHSPSDATLESKTVYMYLQHGIRTVEASAFLDLTPSIVYYRVAGLSLNDQDQSVEVKNKVIAKISRSEVAAKFLQPAPETILKSLVEQGLITEKQAALAKQVPMADDITVEADSGGHTDNRSMVCLLPSILTLRDEVQEKYQYKVPVRVGVAGGIGTPRATLAAFMMGAAYVVTGSINQSCIEAGASEHTKKLLAQAEMPDVMMAPAADMFEMGVRLQVLKRGTLFPLRAQKLFELYKAYDSIESIPTLEREKVEKQIFRRDLESVWEETTEYLARRNPEKLNRAANNPKLKMALIFRWYLGLASRWSNAGEKGRELDYQIWCGPAMGAFNDWVRGTYLSEPKNRRVTDIALHMMTGAALLHRVNSLKTQGLHLPPHFSQYEPSVVQ
jgi:trans-AT polyketide synthase, acyltransferase and oxidoreductase domains